MVLPLIVHLFTEGYGEESIGKVYAVNTFGSIVGTVIATWILMPFWDYDFLLSLAESSDIGIGLYILYTFKEMQYSSMRSFLAPSSGCFVAITVMFKSIDPLLTASGVFRNGTINRHKGHF